MIDAIATATRTSTGGTIVAIAVSATKLWSDVRSTRETALQIQVDIPALQ